MTSTWKEPSTGFDYHRYSTFGLRFWASIIDSLVLLTVPYVVVAAISFIAGGHPLVLLILSLMNSLLGYGYNIWFHWRYGQTIGKMLMGIKVVRNDTEGKLEPTHALLRDAPNMVLLTTWYLLGTPLWLSFVVFAWALVDVLSPLTNEKRRSVHDYIAGTVVVRTR